MYPPFVQKGFIHGLDRGEELKEKGRTYTRNSRSRTFADDAVALSSI